MGRETGFGTSGPRVAPSGWMEAAGYVVLGAGFVVMALGMFEIAGLFEVGLGLAAVLVGCLLIFARTAETGTSAEETFARQLRDL